MSVAKSFAAVLIVAGLAGAWAYSTVKSKIKAAKLDSKTMQEIFIAANDVSALMRGW